MGICYASREDVLSSLDLAETSRSYAQVDRLLDAASRAVEALTHRDFYPTRATKLFAWPNRQMGVIYRLWLDANPLLTVDAITSGGTAITEYFLEPQAYGPPYSHVELDRSTSATFGGTTTDQRNISITGTWGSDHEWLPVATAGATFSANATTFVAADSRRIGVGVLLRIGSEIVQVTERDYVTSSALAAPLTALKNAVTLTLDTPGPLPGETILIDGENMRVRTAIGSQLTVERGVGATPLAEHLTGATLRIASSYTITRGLLGTTAAAHGFGTIIELHQAPADIRSLTVAETLYALGNEESGMARSMGAGDNVRLVGTRTIVEARALVYAAHGRTRKRAV